MVKVEGHPLNWGRPPRLGLETDGASKVLEGKEVELLPLSRL